MAVLARGLPRNFDIVHAHLHEGALIGSIFSKLKRIPLVFDFQGSLRAEMLDHGFISPHDPLEAIFEALEKFINKLPTRIITSSEHSRSVLIDDFGVPPEVVVEVTDCVDATVFQPRSSNEGRAVQIRSELGIPDNTLVVGYLGLLAGYQGITHLLDAASSVLQEFPACHFLIMGYPGESTYRALADRMGIGSRVTFAGRIPYSDAPAYLSALDVAVSPKLSETEGNGKLLNYMACSIPTVAYGAPVARELLGDFGRFAQPGDSRSLAGEILSLLTDANLRAEIGAALRLRACERFSWQAGARKIEAIYEEVLREAR
jgi:glycosyltransferase involved in cell wall biosynthesis